MSNIKSEISIHPFSGQFQSEIGEHISRIQHKEFGVNISLKDQPDLQDIQKFYQHGYGNFWLAMDKEKVIGTIALLDIGNQRAALRKMFVAPEYRGKEIGVSAKLLSTILDWAKSKQIREIILGTTDKFHAAHRFYERNGFEKIDQEALPKEFPVMKVDSIFYRIAI